MQALSVTCAWFIQEEEYGPGGRLFRRGLDLEGDAQSTLLSIFATFTIMTSLASQQLAGDTTVGSSTSDRSSTASKLNAPSLLRSPSSGGDSTASSLSITSNAGQPDPSALVGNLSCIAGLAAALYLHLHYLEGAEYGVFVLAPVALLLVNDNTLFFSLTEKNHYAVPIAICIVVLTSVAVNEVSVVIS